MHLAGFQIVIIYKAGGIFTDDDIRLLGDPFFRKLPGRDVPDAGFVRRFVEFVLIITVVTSFTGLFGMIYVMTGGGPGSSTLTLDFAVWRRAFANGSFGAGAAIGITLMAVTLLAIGLIRLLMRQRSEA